MFFRPPISTLGHFRAGSFFFGAPINLHPLLFKPPIQLQNILLRLHSGSFTHQYHSKKAPYSSSQTDDNFLRRNQHQRAALLSSLLIGVRLVHAADPRYTSLEFSAVEAEDGISPHSVAECEFDVENDSNNTLGTPCRKFRFFIPLVWLRDHCRAPANYNSTTNQRKHGDCSLLFKEAQLADDCYPVEFDEHRQRVTVHWLDGTDSTFTSKQLFDWALFNSQRPATIDECTSRTCWTNGSLKEIPSVSLDRFDFALFARLLIRFGLVKVVGVDSKDERTTRQLCEQIAPIHGTFFGDFWTFGTASGPLQYPSSLSDSPIQKPSRTFASVGFPAASSSPSIDEHHRQRQQLLIYEDTAYGSEEICPHNDGTYFDASPGIQVFHCLRPAAVGCGGHTILVDGFSVAEQLRNSHPEHFHTLTTHPLEHQYVDRSCGGNSADDAKFSTELSSVQAHSNPPINPPSNAHRKLKPGQKDNPHNHSNYNSSPIYARSTMRAPVISLFPGRVGKVAQIRFNPYDRAPMRSIRYVIDSGDEGWSTSPTTNQAGSNSLEHTVRFYAAYAQFSRLVNQSKDQIRFRLTPGTVLFIDNFRVLHGRTSFQGERLMCGCYLSRDGFLARARPFLSPALYKNV